MRNVETFIARRYLLSKRNIRFTNVIGYISVAGITIGVAALLIALSVFNGFNGVVTSVLLGFDPHLRIETKGALSKDQISGIEKVVLRSPGVKAFSPFISGKAMIVTKYANKVVYLRGVDEARIGNVSGLQEKIVLGSLALRDSAGVSGIVLGATLADRLASVIGDEVSIISPTGFQSTFSGTATPPMHRFRVTGIYESNNKDYDASYAYISLQAGQSVFEMGESFSGLEMRLTDLSESESMKSELAKQLSPDLVISTWYDLHRTLYLVMNIERWAAYVLLSLIIVVATFNMLGSLTMSVIEKQRDIGVLKSMGMTSRRIIRIFMVEGMIIGTIGTLLGLVIGLGVLYVQVHFQLFRLDTSVYIIPAIPVDIRWSDFISITAASLGLSWLASYYPARRAAATLPAEALRWE